MHCTGPGLKTGSITDGRADPALDPIATNRIEELLLELKKEFTIIIVTHNMSQAARISDYSMFMYLGELIEYNKTRIMFTNPRDKRTEEYLTGQFG